MFRFNMRPRYKMRDTQPAGDLVRYLRREGEFAPKESEQKPQVDMHDPDVEYMLRTRPDTLEHDDLVGEPMVNNLPAWAHGDASYYFKAASEWERSDGPYAMAFQIALPCELTHEQHRAFAQDWADAIMHDKPYLIVKHEPVKDGQAQPHMHVLMGLRNEDDIHREEWRHFRRWNAAHPELGGAQKDRFWNQRQAPRMVRDATVDLLNFHLERAGIERRIDPRSLRKQGIQRKRLSWENRESLDPATRAHEQALAAQAWEQRKTYKHLGDVAQIPREEMVLLVRQWTRQYARGQALPRVSQDEALGWYERQAQRHARAQETLDREIHTLEVQKQMVERRLGIRHTLTVKPVRQADDHVTQGLKMDLSDDEPRRRYRH